MTLRPTNSKAPLIVACCYGGPPGEKDEKQLHRNPYDEGRCRLTSDRDSCVRSVNVGGENHDEKNDQKYSCEKTNPAHLQANSGQDFADPSKVDYSHWIRNKAWDHTRQVMTHAREMGAGREDQHQSQSGPDGSPPGIQSRNTKVANHAGKQSTEN